LLLDAFLYFLPLALQAFYLFCGVVLLCGLLGGFLRSPFSALPFLAAALVVFFVVVFLAAVVVFFAAVVFFSLLFVQKLP